MAINTHFYLQSDKESLYLSLNHTDMKQIASIILALTLAFPTYAEGGFRWCLYFFDFNSPMKPELFLIAKS